MIATPKQELHALIERLTDDEAAGLSSALLGRQPVRAASPRPLTLEDIILAELLLPEDESADDLSETVRRWRREGGYA